MNRLVHDQYEGSVPGGDQTDDTQRLVDNSKLFHYSQNAVNTALAGFQKLFRIFGVVTKGVGDRKNFHAHGVGSGLPRFADHGIDNLILSLKYNFQGPLDDFATKFHAGRRPGRLCGTGFGNGGGDIFIIGADQLAGGLQGDRAAQLQVTAGVRRFYRFVN